MRTSTAALLLACLIPPACADSLPQPQGPVILEVRGQIEHVNADGAARFDLAMLEALPQRRTRTHTPWHEGVVEFEGPLGRALLQAVGAKGDTLSVTALNDYAAEVPVEDFYRYDIIFALKKDGRYLRVRDNGPLFIIYPFDEVPGLDNELIHNRSVWQIKQIDVQ